VSLKQSRFNFSREALFVILLGFAIRLFICQFTYIINPDGVLYIHQARALYYRQWESLTTCSMSFLSIYPVIISWAYSIFNDWIIAAKSISVLFGSMTLIPVYLLFRRIFDDKISTLGTLVFALMPVFAIRSADVVRGPVYWFFSVLGIYFFVSRFYGSKFRLYLFLSCLSFLLASLARIEAMMFIALSLFFLLIKDAKKIQSSAFFILPSFIALFLILSSSIFLDLSISSIFRINEIQVKFSGPFIEHINLRAYLQDLSNQQHIETVKFFLHKARNLTWLIAIGTLFVYVVKVFFYPFFLLFLAGFMKLNGKIKEIKPIFYLLILSVAALVVLYFHILQTWIISQRFMVLFVLPSFIFIGFGLKNLTNFLKARLSLSLPAALSLVCLLVLVFGLSKDLKPREADKLVFREIGEFIAKQEGNSKEIEIAASLHTIRWLSFYANLNYPGAPCPQPCSSFLAIVGDSYKCFIRNLHRNKFRYFLWEEKHWPNHTFNFIEQKKADDFSELRRWNHPDTGRMILFKLADS